MCWCNYETVIQIDDDVDIVLGLLKGASLRSMLMLIRLGEYWGGWRVVPSAQSQARGHGEGGGVQYQADTRSQNSRTWGCLALLMLYDRFGIFNLS